MTEIVNCLCEVEFGYIVVLNPMMSNVEAGTEFGPFGTLQEAKDFVNGELVEPYEEEGPDMFGGGTKTYRKSFRKGGPLEWYNPPWLDEHGYHKVPLDFRVLEEVG